MKAVAFLGEGKVGLIEIERPAPGPDQVLVRVTRSAICGSDMGADRSVYLAKREQPAVVGHESVGVVAESRDPAWPVGRRVGILVVTGCMRCAACGEGRYTLCAAPGIIPNTNAEFVVVPVANLIAIPDRVTEEEALLGFGCGIGVALSAVNKLAARPGEPVLVAGLGPIGLSTVVVLRKKGLKPVAIDTNRERLRLAEELGAFRGFHPGDSEFGQLAALDGGRPCGYAVLCSGSPQALSMALDLLRKEGQLVFLGAPGLGEVHTFPHLIAKELCLKGSWHFGLRDVPAVLEILGGLDGVDRIVTHTFPLARAQEAYDRFASGRCGKVLLNWEGA